MELFNKGDNMTNTAEFNGDVILSEYAISKLCPEELAKFSALADANPIKSMDEYRALMENIGADDATDVFYGELAKAANAVIDALNAKGLDVRLSYIERDDMLVFQFNEPVIDYSLKPDTEALFSKLGLDVNSVILDYTDA